MSTIKKVKKVETPIDERETFVSLQKSFADSESNTQEKLEILRELQEADNDIEALVQLRGELPAEVAALEEEIAALNSKAAHFEDVIAEYNNSIEAARQNIVELDADIDKYHHQLENISNSREYDSINKELENQGLLRQIAEKNIREAHEAIEDRRHDIEVISDKVSILEDDLAAKKAELDTIIESTAKEEEALTAKRNACAAKIDERTMSAYNRIRASVHNHLAVVPVFNGDSCGGCFNTVTPQRVIDINSGRKLVICEHCGRIIVSARTSSAE